MPSVFSDRYNEFVKKGFGLQSRYLTRSDYMFGWCDTPWRYDNKPVIGYVAVCGDFSSPERFRVDQVELWTLSRSGDKQNIDDVHVNKGLPLIVENRLTGEKEDYWKAREVLRGFAVESTCYPHVLSYHEYSLLHGNDLSLSGYTGYLDNIRSEMVSGSQVYVGDITKPRQLDEARKSLEMKADYEIFKAEDLEGSFDSNFV